MIEAPMLSAKPPKPPYKAPMLTRINSLIQKEKPPKPPQFVRAYMCAKKKGEKHISSMFFLVINNGGYGGYGGFLQRNNNLENGYWGLLLGLLTEQWGLYEKTACTGKKTARTAWNQTPGTPFASFSTTGKQHISLGRQTRNTERNSEKPTTRWERPRRSPIAVSGASTVPATHNGPAENTIARKFRSSATSGTEGNS